MMTERTPNPNTFDLRPDKTDCRRAFDGGTVTFSVPILGREYPVRTRPLTEPDGAIGAIVGVAQEMPAPPRGAEAPSSRPRAVAAFVAAGLTNGQIAERLTIGTGTVGTPSGASRGSRAPRRGVWAAICGPCRRRKATDGRTISEAASRRRC